MLQGLYCLYQMNHHLRLLYVVQSLYSAMLAGILIELEPGRADKIVEPAEPLHLEE